MARVVIRLLFLDINNALEVTYMELLICNQLLIDFLVASIRKILYSLLSQPQIILMYNLQYDSKKYHSKFKIGNDNIKK